MVTLSAAPLSWQVTGAWNVLAFDSEESAKWKLNMWSKFSVKAQLKKTLPQALTRTLIKKFD